MKKRRFLLLAGVISLLAAGCRPQRGAGRTASAAQPSMPIITTCFARCSGASFRQQETLHTARVG